MLHVLSLLNITAVEQKVCFPWCMCSRYPSPERLLAQARQAWLNAQQDEMEQTAGQFVRDMLHVNISTVKHEVLSL
jgi:hypothetical protein